LPVKKKILIVDDSPVNLILLDSILSRVGYNVIQATNGEDAIQIARKEHPDLIILDIVMPGIDGLEAASRLKDQSATRTIPIIFVSSLVKKHSSMLKKMMPGHAFLPKPFKKQALLKEIREHLENPGPSKAGEDFCPKIG